MNYKELFIRLYKLITSPKKAWIEISTESPRVDVMSSFVYPLIALCGLTVLLNAFIHDGMGRDMYQPALMKMCSYCVALFGGFFLASWLVDTLKQRLLGHTSNMPESQVFVGYAMGAMFFADILIIIFPSFFIFKWILQFYVLYIVWEGSNVLFTIADNKRLTFTILASAAIVFSPTIIRELFNLLSNTFG